MKQRQVGPDVLRTLAIVFVVLIHAIGLSIDGYDRALVGLDGFIRIYLRRICYTSVPIFLMLSGYLNFAKTDVVKTYKKEFPRVVVPMLFWGIAVAIFECVRNNVSNVLDICNVFAGLLNFSIGQGRLWYMNMYLGLLILMPYINRLWGTLEKKDKLFLLGALILLSVVSKYTGQISGGKVVLISNYFYSAAYITYYLIGMYIRDYQPKLHKGHIFLLQQMVLFLHTGYYLARGYGLNYNDIPNAVAFWYDNPVLVVESMLLFLLFYDWQFASKWAIKAVWLVSTLSFDMYLNSYIFDYIAYDLWSGKYYVMSFYVVLALCALFSFLASAIFAYVRLKFVAIIKAKKNVPIQRSKIM